MKNSAIKRMFAAAKQTTVLDLYIYDIIGQDWFGQGCTPQSVADAIKEAGDFSSINVHINSPGGDSFDGVAIHNILRQQNVPINILVEGLAASAAFTISMAGDTIKVCDAGMMMLHNAWGMTAGPASEMRQTADILDKVSGTMRDMYAKRSGMKPKDVAALMDAETWLTGPEAVAQGFATGIASTTPEQSKDAQSLVAQFRELHSKTPEKFKGGIAVPPGPPGVEDEAGCSCPCGECKGGDCDECTHDGCSCDGCEDCDMQARAKASIPVPQGPPGGCDCDCEACSTGDCKNCSVENCTAEGCDHGTMAKAKKSSTVDPDGDGDDDSAIVDAIKTGSQSCTDCATLLDAAADKYDDKSLGAARTECSKTIAVLEKAVKAIDTETSEGSNSSADNSNRARLLVMRQRQQGAIAN